MTSHALIVTHHLKSKRAGKKKSCCDICTEEIISETKRSIGRWSSYSIWEEYKLARKFANNEIKKAKQLVFYTNELGERQHKPSENMESVN
jgi:hypothetical protein